MLRLSGLPVVLHHVGLAKLAKEVLVVSDDDELEVRVILALVDDTGRTWSAKQTCRLREHVLDQARSESIDVLCVKRVGGLIQGEDAAVLAERV